MVLILCWRPCFFGVEGYSFIIVYVCFLSKIVKSRPLCPQYRLVQIWHSFPGFVRGVVRCLNVSGVMFDRGVEESIHGGALCLLFDFALSLEPLEMFGNGC